MGDSKLCGQSQLDYITENHGRAITIVPSNWLEVEQFKNMLRAGPIKKKLIWRRSRPNNESKTEYYYVYEKHPVTQLLDKYSLWWIVSSEKRKRDRYSREDRLKKAESSLIELSATINRGKLKKKGAIEKAALGILEKRHVRHLMGITVKKHMERK